MSERERELEKDRERESADEKLKIIRKLKSAFLSWHKNVQLFKVADDTVSKNAAAGPWQTSQL